MIRAGSPVVTISLGDSCVFRFGNDERPSRPYQDVRLASGDLFVFGGPSRLSYHGVPKVFVGTAPPDLGLHGRVSVTLRQIGVAGEAGSSPPRARRLGRGRGGEPAGLTAIRVFCRGTGRCHPCRRAEARATNRRTMPSPARLTWATSEARTNTSGGRWWAQCATRAPVTSTWNWSP